METLSAIFSRLISVISRFFSELDFSRVLNLFDLSRLKDILLYDAHSPLLFNTGLFLILFLFFMIIYKALRGHNRLRMVFVILFSLYFYYKSSAWCCFILLGVCISDYLLGRWLGFLKTDWKRRAIVFLNVVINVGMLVYFKYFNLLLDALSQITSRDFDVLDIVLPAGISFFTFRSISYIVDIYRREMEPARNFIDYCFFLTFFPPLLAGPVVRAKDMLPQIYARPEATREQISRGLMLIMFGLVKKVIVADYISGNFVDRIFDNPSLYSGFENLMGCIGFTLQLYCDFSGYSDMAIGIALLLGYEFKDNFNAPFKAQNPSDFWRRWHISLSTWLRDYLYIPMGGNRKGKFRTYLNNFMTMVIGGLWHGASWMYIIWGAYHGLLLAIHKMFKRIWHLPEALKGNFVIRFVNMAVTFSLVVAGFALFRAPSLSTIGDMATQIWNDFHIDVAPQFVESYLLIVAAIAAGYFMHFTPKAWTTGTIRFYNAMPAIIQSIFLAALLFIVIQSRQSELVPFVYLQY